MPFRFESLDIWYMARGYARKIYTATTMFPRHEDYGLRSQMNRAANSIGLNIAEGSAKGCNKAFACHLEVAVGSTFEVATASFLAIDNAYISWGEQKELYDEGQKLAKSSNAIRNMLRQRCLATGHPPPVLIVAVYRSILFLPSAISY